MNPLRRALLAGALAPWATAAVGAGREAGDPVRRGRPWRWPRDHGAHPGSAIEWWYATGWATDRGVLRYGFQVTFFRARTGQHRTAGGRFAAPQLLFAHAALTDLASRTHRHGHRIARWNGLEDAVPARAAIGDAALRIGRWWMQRDDGGRSRWRARVDGDVAFEVDLRGTQPVLLQGDAGFSRKGPGEIQASHYYTEPQLQATLRLLGSDRGASAAGRAWLDHEWSDSLLHPSAIGWDWIGMNLDDGSALTAFRLRRADGTTLWSGGSFRPVGQPVRAFVDGEVRMVPGRDWSSPATGTRYPVQWEVDTPVGRFEVEALLDAQELDGRLTTGTLYWEGLARLLDASRRRVGLGYLELTGYGQPLRLGA